MPLIASNDEELEAMVLKDMERVINDLTEYLLNQVTMFVYEEVYSYPESDFYERLGMNGGFLGAWEKTIAKIAGDCVMASVDMNWQLMDYNAANHQHGNSVDDRRKYLADYIRTGTNYDFGGNASMARDFWTPILDMIYDGSLDQKIESLFIKYGIQFQRII